MSKAHKKLLNLSLPLLLCAISCLAFWGAQTASKKSIGILQQTLLARLKFDITASVDSLVESGSRLAVLLSENVEADDSAIQARADRILKENPSVKGIAIAPDAIVQRYFPASGNENLLGHDLLTNPERRESLALAVESRKPIVSGPFSSVEGLVFFIRYPVFRYDKLWGFISLTVSFNEFQKSMNLVQQYPGLHISIARSNRSASAFSSQVQLHGETWDVDLNAGTASALFSIALVFLFGISLSASVFLFFMLRLKAIPLLEKSGMHEMRKAEDFKPKHSKIGAAKGQQMPIMALDDQPEADTKADPAQSPSIAPLASSASTVSTAPSASAALNQTSEPAPAQHNRSLHKVGNTEYGMPKTVSRPKREKVEFIGPDVPGQLFMPEMLVDGNPAQVFAAYAEKKPEPEQEIKFHATESHVPASHGLEHEAQLMKPQLMKSHEQEALPIELHMQQEADRSTPLELDFGKGQGKALTKPDTPEAAQPAQTVREISILVVDDSEANRDIMGRMLALKKHHAEFASSGSEALSRCAAVKFDIIFMDCFMPGMDGYKTARALRDQKLAEKSVIIGMSAKVGQHELDLCIEAGMDDLLSKPFTINELESRIRKHLF